MDEFDYALTNEGLTVLEYIVGEFCHGYTIEEIASNTDHISDANDIKAMFLVLFTHYRRLASESAQ